LIRDVGDGRLDWMALSERDRAILDFEGSWWTVPGSKNAAVKTRFGLSSSRYRQILTALIDSDEAEAFSPLLVRRLRRERDRRRRLRYEGRPTGGVTGRRVT
jgi:Protein of unknown function (DUF3263)